MPAIDIGNVFSDLQRRFAAPLPEFCRRRIIFWLDPDREFIDHLDALHLDDVTLVKLDGTNSFAVKKLLQADDLTGNYLVYEPQTFNDLEKDWLLNLKLQCEEFRADLCSIHANELGLPDDAVIRKVLKHYSRFLQNEARRRKLKPLCIGVKEEKPLQLAVMAAICGVKKASAGEVITGVLMGGLDAQSNAAYADLAKYNALPAFWEMVKQSTGCGESKTNPLEHLATHILLTALSITIRAEDMGSLTELMSPYHQPFCHEIVADWLNSKQADQLLPIAQSVGQRTYLGKYLEKLTLEAIAAADVFPCVNEVLLLRMMNEMKQDLVKPDKICQIAEKRRTMAWYELTACYWDALRCYAEMLRFAQEHAEGFHLADTRKIWKAYTQDYYRMDTAYRRFHNAFTECLKVSHPQLDDPMKVIVDRAENLYKNWFLADLAENWTNVAETDLKDKWWIADTHESDMTRQTKFYDQYVYSETGRVFVIISDALRYEVGAALAEQLRQEMPCKLELKSQQSIFPSATKFGMAALLPHEKLTADWNGKIISVLADGQSTDSNNREDVLRKTNPKSKVLRYDDIIGMKKEERRSQVAGMEVIYLYHDKIDAAGHVSEADVFPACEAAIAELKNLVRIIVNDLSGVHIVITADHGFLYTYQPLNEADKVSGAELTGKVLEKARRYAITESGASSGTLIPIRFMDGQPDFEAYAPRENIRLKVKGAGMNFVHGGISLQELVVPVIEYHHIRTDSKKRESYETKPVSVALLSSTRKIFNRLFSLSFYQKEPVGDTRESACYIISMMDAHGQPVSDRQRIIADKRDSDERNRVFTCAFALKSGIRFSNQETYKLTITREGSLEPPVEEEFTIDIAMQMDDDFDFGL